MAAGRLAGERLHPAPVTPRGQIHVAVLGARQHYALPKLLHRAGRLGRFYTDYYLPGGIPARLLRAVPQPLRPAALKRLMGNSDPELPREKVVSFNGLGFRYRWNTSRAADALSLERIYAGMGAPFARFVIRRGLEEAETLYSCNGSALELFRHAKQQGIRCILEQIHIPQDLTRTLLQKEQERWPGWEPGLLGKSNSRVIEEREREEWSLADRILGGSEKVVHSVRDHDVPAEKCRMVPYGIPLERFPPRPPPDTARRKLRVLFLGGVGLRKGTPYLLEALRLVGPDRVEARLAGQILAAKKKLRPYAEVAAFLGPVPRSETLDLYHWADLLVLPSICEGSSLATYEALACGIPVVATPNAGAWIRQGVDGLLVPVGNTQALAETLERLAADPGLLRELQLGAVEGRERLGLDGYAERLLDAIDA